jgi:hypothetical protein
MVLIVVISEGKMVTNSAHQLVNDVGLAVLVG